MVRVSFPAKLPGVHFGIIETKRSASLSNRGSTPFIIFPFVTLPSFSTANFTITLPSIPFAIAS